MVRARVRWAEGGEKPTRYLSALESRYYINKIIPCVCKEDGTLINKQDEISQEFECFYSNLFSYQERNQDINVEKNSNNLNNHPKLSEEEKASLERDIAEEEVTFILSKMKK